MWRHVPLGLLGACLALLGPAAGAVAPVFETWAAPSTPGGGLGGTDAALQVEMPVWWDVTLDGAPDLVFFSGYALDRLHLDEAGDLMATEVEHPGVNLEPRSVLAPIDIDGDGVDELLAIGRGAILLRVVGENRVEESAVPLPAFRARGTNDAAVGDLNRDGLPDVYLGIGLAYSERLNLQGRTDTILMNRGDGRFEAIPAAPVRIGLTNGITLVDIDGDGWLDVVESVDTSWITGRSRLLFNRTQPGDSTPTFEPSEHTWDIGTDGMGAAVADIDGDGHLDIYNTSIGHDLLVMGRGEGRFEDETFARGILHHWSSLGLRFQWAPTFVDLNADGRHDLLVRHGITAQFDDISLPSAWAADLVYTQGADGLFTRVAVPVQPGIGGGYRFAVGDLEGDGLPDAGRDGGPGEVLFWHNATPVDAATRTLVVRLAGTVSGSPATGAIVEGSCAGQTHTRHITSGGKMGAGAASEAYLAWPDCAADPVTVSVHWPSGAVTVDEVPGGATVWLASEPRWVEAGPDGLVTLDPAGTSADEACLQTEDGSWSCCADRCQLSRPASGPALARLDAGVPMALPAREASWLLVTTPHLPRPGEEATVHLLHVGGAETFPGDEAVLTQEGEAVAWTTVDEAARTLSAVVTAATEAEVLSLALNVDGSEVGAWTPSVGVVFDSADAWTDVYPVRPTGTTLAGDGWRVNLHAMAGVFHPGTTAGLTLSTPDGVSVPTLAVVPDGAALRFVTLKVAWDDLAGVDTLLIRDRAGGVPISLPVVVPATDDDLLQHVGSAACGLDRGRLQPTRDRSLGVLSVFDHAGHPMVVPGSLVDMSVEGGTLVHAPLVTPGLMDMSFAVEAGDALGEGEIVVAGADGQQWGRCGFTVTEWPARPVNLAASWATLSRTELTHGPYQATRLRVGILDSFEELMGADVWPTILLSGGSWLQPLVLSGAGTLAGDIRPNDDADAIQITVTVEGKVLEAFTVTLTGEATEADDAGAEDPPPPGGGCECQGGQGTSWLTPLAWVLLVLGILRRRAGPPRLSRPGALSRVRSMSPRLRLCCAALTGLIALAGCPPEPGPDAGDATGDGSTTVPDIDDVPGVALGTHVQWKQQPEHFRVLEDEGELPIVMGHQGLWMVVLALRSYETLEGDLDLVIKVDAAGSTLGTLQLVGMTLDPELDGRDYIYDIWLIVSDPSLATYTAQVTIDIVDSNGLELTVERSVVLGGGSL